MDVYTGSIQEEELLPCFHPPLSVQPPPPLPAPMHLKVDVFVPNRTEGLLDLAETGLRWF